VSKRSPMFSKRRYRWLRSTGNTSYFTEVGTVTTTGAVRFESDPSSS
jgi:hypothetical protein